MDIRKIKPNRIWGTGLVIIIWSFIFSGHVWARPSVGLDLERAPNNTASIVARITLVADPGKKIKAAGLELVYPGDRVRFAGLDAIDGVVIKSGLSQGKGLLTIGLVDVSGHERHDLTLHFDIVGAGHGVCIPMVIPPSGLENDLQGASVSSVRAYCPERPDGVEVWSNPDERANLFLIVPNVRGLKGASISYGQTDVTAALVTIGSYFYDPIRDVFYYILPGIALPPGQYPLEVSWDYGQGRKTQGVIIGVLNPN